MGRLPQTNTTVSRYLRQQKRVVTRMANATPYALSGTSVTAPGLMKVDERLVAGDPVGSRVELDSAGLRKYAADGTTVQVDLTGDVAAFSGLITGSEIIAGTAGAARLELDAAGLRQYAADGTTVLLDTADDATIRARGDSTALGSRAQEALTTGTGNTAVGSSAQLALTDGDYNTAVGPYAQRALTTGFDNTAIGRNAQRALITGGGNTAVGGDAQQAPLGFTANATTTASAQTSIGYQSGQSSATQVNAITTIGYRATAGANNATSIGKEARADHVGSIALGYQSLTTQADQVMVGPRDVEITDATKGLVLVSPDTTRMRITAADDGSLLVNGTAIGGGSGGSPASETVAGIVELATSAETVTGTDTARAVTPAGVAAAIYEPGAAGTGVSYSAGWADYGGGAALVTWYKDKDGWIRLSGLLKRTGTTITAAASGTIFTLPVGARPVGSETFITNKDAVVAFMRVGSDGIVSVNAPSTWTSGVSFMYVSAVMFKAA